MTIYVLGALFVLWPLIALAGGLGFSMLTGFAALLLLPSVARSLRPRLYFFALLAFFVFAGVTALWSPREQVLVSIDFNKMQFAMRSEMLRVGLQILALGGLLAAAMRLDDRGKARLQAIAQWALLGQLAILIVLTVFETQILDMLRVIVPDTGEGVQNISRNSIIMAAAAPLLAIGLARGRSRVVGAVLAAAVVLAVAVVLVLRGVNTGLLSFAAAAFCILVVHFFPRHGFKILGVLVAGLVVSAPLVFGLLTHGADYASADDSSSYRAAIWQNVITLINQHPLTGSGLGALRTMRETIDAGVFAGELKIPNHAHNMMLQLWAETGAIGAGLLSLAIFLAGWRMPEPRSLGVAGLKAAAVVGAMLTVACVSFDLWNDWWWAVGGLLAVLAVATPAPVAVAHAKE